MIIGATKLRTDKIEFIRKYYWVKSEYLKWIPVPNAKLKELKIRRVRNPYFKSLFETFEIHIVFEIKNEIIKSTMPTKT